MILEFQRTDGVRNAFYGVLDRMGKIIHGVDTPCIPGIVMAHMRHAVDHRIPHIHIGGSHIDLRPKHFLPILIDSVLHILEQLQILFHCTIPVWTVFSRLFQRSAVFADLFCRQVTYIGFSLFDQLHCRFIHLLKIVGRKKKPVLPVRAQPLDVTLDRIHEFRPFFGRIRIVKPHIEFSVVFLCQPVIQQDGFGMSDMQIPVRLRWKAGVDRIVDTLRQIPVNLYLNKIFGNHFIFHNRILLVFYLSVKRFYHSILLYRFQELQEIISAVRQSFPL